MTRIKVSSNALEHEFGDEAILLHLPTETYYSMNEIAVSIWRALAKSITVEQVLELLLEEYNVDRATLKEDLVAFIEKLRQANLIEVIPD